jgi:ferrous iron transport protein A
MARTLDSLQPGESVVVQSLDCDPEAGARLMEMGLLPGTPIQFVRSAPLGDPIEILLRGYHLSLRRAEAAGIVVE